MIWLEIKITHQRLCRRGLSPFPQSIDQVKWWKGQWNIWSETSHLINSTDRCVFKKKKKKTLIPAWKALSCALRFLDSMLLGWHRTVPTRQEYAPLTCRKPTFNWFVCQTLQTMERNTALFILPWNTDSRQARSCSPNLTSKMITAQSVKW